MIYYVYTFICILLTGVGQVLLKIGARRNPFNSKMYLNPYTISGYLLILLVTVFTVLALGGLSLKVLYTLMSLNYVLIIVLSWALLREKIGTNKILATAFIVLGVIVFNI